MPRKTTSTIRSVNSEILSKPLFSTHPIRNFERSSTIIRTFRFRQPMTLTVIVNKPRQFRFVNKLGVYLNHFRHDLTPLPTTCCTRILRRIFTSFSTRIRLIRSNKSWLRISLKASIAGTLCRTMYFLISASGILVGSSGFIMISDLLSELMLRLPGLKNYRLQPLIPYAGPCSALPKAHPASALLAPAKSSISPGLLAKLSQLVSERPSLIYT